MSDIRVNALLIKAIDYSENDKLLTLLTLERGKITAKIKGCKGLKSKLRYASSPLSFGEYLLTSRDNRYIVTGCNLKDNFAKITEDLSKFYVASLILELSNKLTRDNIDCKEYLVAALKLLGLLCYSNTDSLIVGIKAFLDIMEISGYAINTKGCYSCGLTEVEYFSLSNGNIVCRSHKRPYDIKVNNRAMKLLDSIIDSEEVELEGIKEEKIVKLEVINLLNTYFSHQTEIKLNSATEIMQIL